MNRDFLKVLSAVILLSVIVIAVPGWSTEKKPVPKAKSAVVNAKSVTGKSTAKSVVGKKPTAKPAAGKKPVAKAPVKKIVKAPVKLPRLVDLGSTTCIPCKMMTPVLEALGKDYKGKLKVEFIDVSKNAEAARQYRVRSIPTQVFLDADGKEFFRHEGYYPKEDILAKFKQHGINLGKGK